MFYDSRPVSDQYVECLAPICDCCFAHGYDLDLTRYEWIESDRDFSHLPQDGGYICSDCKKGHALVECGDIVCDAEIAALYMSEGF